MQKIRLWVGSFTMLVAAVSAMGNYDVFEDPCCSDHVTEVSDLETVALLGLFGAQGYIDQSNTSA